MQTIYEMEAANLFIDEPDPQKSQYMTIENLKIPGLQEKTHSHTGGGALSEIRIGARVFEPMEFTFSLRGINPLVMNRVMSAPGRLTYTVTGNVRDVIHGTEMPGKVVIDGRMTKADIGQFTRDSGTSTEYQIDEVIHYALYLNNIEKYWFQYEDGPLGWRVDGQVVFQNMARNLGLL